jgi:SAM-dependent methyltransferase
MTPLRTLSRADLDELAARTVSHYEDGAESFWQSTRDHDVTQNIEALLRALPASDDERARVLDVGCGPGRDLMAFAARGLEPTGVDGCRAFADGARARATPSRYGSFLQPATWCAYFVDAGFVLVDEYFRPSGKPRAEQPWHVSVWRRPLA